MVVSWARAILSLSKKAWTFPARPYYYILSFLKINGMPNNSKIEGRKGHAGPPGQPRGEELPWRFLSRPMTLSQTGCIPAAPNSCPWGREESDAFEQLNWIVPYQSPNARRGALGSPLEVRMGMANYVKCLERLLKFQRMKGPLEWGYIRRSVGPWSFHGGSEWPAQRTGKYNWAEMRGCVFTGTKVRICII